MRKELKEALEFYADPFAWKKKHDPDNDVRVPDFYSETSFGDTAVEALGALATAPAPAEDVRAVVIEQHIGWLKLYIEGMTVDNWRDIQLRAARKLEELSEEIDRALANNRGEPST